VGPFEEGVRFVPAIFVIGFAPDQREAVRFAVTQLSLRARVLDPDPDLAGQRTVTPSGVDGHDPGLSRIADLVGVEEVVVAEIEQRVLDVVSEELSLDVVLSD
jgi:hypothetical protein